MSQDLNQEVTATPHGVMVARYEKVDGSNLAVGPWAVVQALRASISPSPDVADNYACLPLRPILGTRSEDIHTAAPRKGLSWKLCCISTGISLGTWA